MSSDVFWTPPQLVQRQQPRARVVCRLARSPEFRYAWHAGVVGVEPVPDDDERPACDDAGRPRPSRPGAASSASPMHGWRPPRGGCSKKTMRPAGI